MSVLTTSRDQTSVPAREIHGGLAAVYERNKVEPNRAAGLATTGDGV